MYEWQIKLTRINGETVSYSRALARLVGVGPAIVLAHLGAFEFEPGPGGAFFGVLEPERIMDLTGLCRAETLMALELLSRHQILETLGGFVYSLRPETIIALIEMTPVETEIVRVERGGKEQRGCSTEQPSCSLLEGGYYPGGYKGVQDRVGVETGVVDRGVVGGKEGGEREGEEEELGGEKGEILEKNQSREIFENSRLVSANQAPKSMETSQILPAQARINPSSLCLGMGAATYSVIDVSPDLPQPKKKQTKTAGQIQKIRNQNLEIITSWLDDEISQLEREAVNRLIPEGYPGKITWLTPYAIVWDSYFGANSHRIIIGQCARYFRFIHLRAVKYGALDEFVAAWAEYVGEAFRARKDIQYISPAKFASTYKYWVDKVRKKRVEREKKNE
jgi:hypothetical protein